LRQFGGVQEDSAGFFFTSRKVLYDSKRQLYSPGLWVRLLSLLENNFGDLEALVPDQFHRK